MTRHRPWRIGIVAGALYLAVLAATSHLSSHPVRPLFEGIGPTAPYRWVNPPKEFAAGNQRPDPLKTSVALGRATSLNTSDGQVIVNLSADAIPAHDPDNKVDVAIDPLDPATLGPVPAPLRADGNANHITLTYSPSGTAIGSIATAGNVVLQVPEPAETILFSADGHDWQRLDAHTAGQSTLEGATFAQPGFYLAATSAPAASSSDGGSTWPAYAAFIATVTLAGALAVTTQLRRKRRRQTRQTARSRQRRRSSPTATRSTRSSDKRRR